MGGSANGTTRAAEALFSHYADVKKGPGPQRSVPALDQQGLGVLLAKGDDLTPEEADQARTLISTLDDAAFHRELQVAMQSGALYSYLEHLDHLLEGREGNSHADTEMEHGGKDESMTDTNQPSLDKSKKSGSVRQVKVRTALLKPSENTIAWDFKRANAIYNRHGIEVERGHHITVSEKTTKTLLGNDKQLDTPERGMSHEEHELFNLNRQDGQISAYWVPGVTSAGLRGLTYTMGADATSIAVNSAKGGHVQDTFAHELGHALGLPHKDSEPKNLMASGSIRQISGKKIDRLDKHQLNVIRHSIFMKLGKKGLGK